MMITAAATGRNGNYDDHVRALAAVRRLDPDLYGEVVRKWACAHERRGNPWAVIAKR